LNLVIWSFSYLVISDQFENLINLQTMTR